MSELRALVEVARELRARQEPFLSATVVRVRGSGYRRAGARMLASQDRWLAGSISGGCLERDVMTKGFWRTRSEHALLVTYDESEDALDERSGSGCQGVVDVLLEQHLPGAPGESDVFAAAERCIRDESIAVVVTVFRSTRSDVPVGARLFAEAGVVRCTPESAYLRSEFAREIETAFAARPPAWVAKRGGSGSTHDPGEVEVLVECIVPPPHMFVFGAGHDVPPLVTLARNVGWTVSVWDALPRTASRERLRAADHYLTGSLEEVVALLDRSARPAAVIMGHHFEQDRAALAALVRSNARYIGVLGPRQRTERMLADCRAAGVFADDAALARVYAPVGLQLGAHTPAEIALAIVAEAQAAFTNSDVTALRSQPGSIHHRATPTQPLSASLEGRWRGGGIASGVRIGCALLAAGSSTRLGRPKQLLALDGKPLVRHVLDQLQAVGLTRYAVVLGSCADQVGSELATNGCDLLDNAAWAEGIAASIRVAAAWARAHRLDALLLAACDQPRLTSEHVFALCEAHVRHGAPVASGYGGTLGIPAIVGASWYARLESLAGDRGAGALLRNDASVIALEWPDGAIDVDTPEDAESSGLT